jgi:hypothetical protein
MQGVPGRTVRFARLVDLVDVLPGFSTGGTIEHDPVGTHQVVLSRHLTPGLPYHYKDEDRLRINPQRDASRYELRSGDVLFMSRGTRNVASPIASVPDRTIAPVSFYVLRPRGNVHPGYLAWHLSQPAAQRELAQIRTGAGTPLVQRAAFAELRVPIPDAITQQRIAELGELMARERVLLHRLAAATVRVQDHTSDRLASILLAKANGTMGDHHEEDDA